MRPNKYPGFELTLLADDIDFKINEKLKGKWIIKTDTQYINDKGEIIDAFDMKIYNPETGNEKSLIEHSPGQRVWFDLAISEVLRSVRQERQNIIFMYSFSDETDGAIQHDAIQDYYTMIHDSLNKGHKRYVVSHSPEAEGFILNQIDIMSIGVEK